MTEDQIEERRNKTLSLWIQKGVNTHPTHQYLFSSEGTPFYTNGEDDNQYVVMMRPIHLNKYSPGDLLDLPDPAGVSIYALYNDLNDAMNVYASYALDTSAWIPYALVDLDNGQLWTCTYTNTQEPITWHSSTERSNDAQRIIDTYSLERYDIDVANGLLLHNQPDDCDCEDSNTDDTETAITGDFVIS